jgi:hypothetical protein
MDHHEKAKASFPFYIHRTFFLPPPVYPEPTFLVPLHYDLVYFILRLPVYMCMSWKF